MKDKWYLAFRKLFFWIFLLIFIVITPILVFYSLGYKFDITVKKFIKTGAIAIKTVPENVTITLDGKKISESTPCIIRNLLPRKYMVALEKENFCSYRLDVDVRSSAISEIDILLIPKIRDIEKLRSNLNIQQFFVIKQLFNEKIIAFTNDGIYGISDNFEHLKKITDLDVTPDVIRTIEGLKEDKNKLIFWNKDSIWLVNLLRIAEEKQTSARLVYSAADIIKKAFFALKDSYIIVHDGKKVIALDIQNYGLSFKIVELKSDSAEIFYDSESDTLYIRDAAFSKTHYSLFKIDMRKLIYENPTN